jgi:hypothetical protein
VVALEPALHRHAGYYRHSWGRGELLLDVHIVLLCRLSSIG